MEVFRDEYVDMADVHEALFFSSLGALLGCVLEEVEERRLLVFFTLVTTVEGGTFVIEAVYFELDDEDLGVEVVLSLDVVADREVDVDAAFTLVEVALGTEV